MSFAGHVLCQRMLIGVAWPFEIIGKPSVAPAAATPVAAFRNLRRERAALRASGNAGTENLRVMLPPLKWRRRAANGLIRRRFESMSTSRHFAAGLGPRG